MNLGGPREPGCRAPTQGGNSARRSWGARPPGKKQCTLGAVVFRSPSSRVGGGPERQSPPQSRLLSTSHFSGPMRSPAPGARPSAIRPPLVLRPSSGALPGSNAGGGGFLDYDTGKLGEVLWL